MKVLITGINGFVGSHLTEYLLSQKGIRVFGLDQSDSLSSHLQHLAGHVSIYACDLRDRKALIKIVKEIKPDRIIHLAAQSFVPRSWEDPVETIEINVIGTINLFEVIRQINPEARVLVTCSSEEYGLVKPHELPVTEKNPFRPLSPYAVSKVTQDLLCHQYFRNYKLPVICTRSFNHTGPRQNASFVIPSFACQIAEIEKGQREPVLKVGNLEAVRDFSDVRDIIRGYWMALETAEPGMSYNICSGQGIAIQEILNRLLALTEMPIQVEQDPTRMRPSDVPRLVGDFTLFQQATGWQPEIPLDQTLRDILTYWRAAV